MKAFAYVRVSGLAQRAGHGPERQEEAIAAFARAEGIEVAQTFLEVWTGKEEERPVFADMLVALKSNGTRIVIVESLDRLARSLSTQMALVSLLGKEGFTLRSANTGADVTADVAEDPMREAMILMQGVFAQLERKLIVQKLRKARDAKRRATGRCEGRLPYGSRPGEQAVLDRIRALRRARLSWRRVAERLNAEGLRPRHAATWSGALAFGVARG